MSRSAEPVASLDLVQPFIDSTCSVFSMMLGNSIELTDLCNCQGFTSGFDLSGIIGFLALRGTIVVSLDEQTALGAAERLLGMRPEKIDDDVRDMLGELANMIGGNAKERMGDCEIVLGLPTVISGKGHEVSFDAGAEVHKLCFLTQWGPLAIELGLRAVTR